jgi:hypothetical protein
MNGSSIGWGVLDFFHFGFIRLKSVSLSGLFSGDFQEMGGCIVTAEFGMMIKLGFCVGLGGWSRPSMTTVRRLHCPLRKGVSGMD